MIEHFVTQWRVQDFFHQWQNPFYEGQKYAQNPPPSPLKIIMYLGHNTQKGGAKYLIINKEILVLASAPHDSFFLSGAEAYNFDYHLGHMPSPLI